MTVTLLELSLYSERSKSGRQSEKKIMSHLVFVLLLVAFDRNYHGAPKITNQS